MNFYNKSMFNVLKSLFLAVFVLGIVSSCSLTKPKSEADKPAQRTVSLNKIIGVEAKKDSGSTVMKISGEKELVYSAVKETSPDAIALYFPDTTLAKGLNNYDRFDGAFSKAEVNQDGQDSKIKLLLTGDYPYSVSKDGSSLLVKIETGNEEASQAAVSENNAAVPNETSEDKPEGAVSLDVNSTDKKEEVQEAPILHEATTLKDIKVEDESDYLKISIIADGTITKYNSFTLNNPPRIVFDILNLKSPYKKMEKLKIDSRWAKSLRHYTNNVRFRAVIDSREKWLKEYGAKESPYGLEIVIGKRNLKNTPVIKEVKKDDIPGEKKKKAAYLTSINFSSLEDGKSKVIIGTSREIDFKTVKNDKNKLALKLLNTRIPKYQQRPIITTRFDSAINRIFPVYNRKVNKKDSLIYIDLREDVPFKINKTDKIIEVEFSSSSVSTGMSADLKAPEWQAILGTEAVAKSEEPIDAAKEQSKKEIPGKEKAGVKVADATVQASAAVKADKTEMMTVETPTVKEPEIAYGEKRYTGQPITLDFYETDIKNVFRILQHVSGLNFAIDKDVKGKVTMTLKQPVPWDQVLDLILKMNSLGMEKDGNIVRIALLSTLKNEEDLKKAMLQAKQESKKQEKALAPLETEYLLINYSDAGSEIMPHLKKITSKRGSLSVDKRNNQIIMTDTRENISKAKQIIERIDRITPQVVIEARIVEANTDFSKNIGTDWQASTYTGNKSNYATIYKDALGGSYGYNVSMNTPQSTGSIGINFARIAGTPFILNATLNAMETEKKGKIISAPKVVTLDNKEATITQGYEYPYTTLKDGETTVEFKDINLELKVTPHVTADNKISLKVNIDKNDIYVQTSDGPALSTKNIQTELLVNDGDTIVIGGIIQKTDNLTENSFPILSKIPVLGWFFKSKLTTANKQELLIFLTPRIVELDKGKF